MYIATQNKISNILALQGPDIEAQISDCLRLVMHYVWRNRRHTIRFDSQGRGYNKMQIIALRMMYRAQRMNRGQFIIYRRMVEAGVVGAPLTGWEPR